MKLLVVSYWYPPSISPRAFRWSALAELWAERGWEVDVVAGWSPGLARRERMGGVRVFRPGFHLRGAARSTLARLRGSTSPAVESSVARARPAGRMARWLYERTAARVYWPDDAGPWIPSAIRLARRLARERRYDALVTVSHPFSAHLVGAMVHGRLGRAPWVADVGDPFSFLADTPTNNHALYGPLNRAAERGILRRCTAAAVTVEGARGEYARHFPEAAHKLRVIPPLLAPAELDPAPLFPRDGTLRLVFSGNLYARVRSPAFCLALFAALRERMAGRVELHFFGNVRQCWDAFAPHLGEVDRSIFLHGVVDRAHALRALRDATVLVNLGNRTSFQLPSKTVEYLASGKPVLNLVAGDDDTSAAFFDGYPGALTVAEEEGGPSPATVERVAAMLASARPLPQAQVERWIAPHRTPAVAAAYEALLGAREAWVMEAAAR
ncbi:MAG: glycosyltransferase [Gemmatimonadetes bacterium]|nr:glycosyltransferase [Gemmatimonadota bacterium]